MTTWQVDFYRRPLRDQADNPLWELVVAEPQSQFAAFAFCSQPQANSSWLTAQLQAFGKSELPERVQVFRPQALSLIEAACKPLGIPVEATRHTPALKQLLQVRTTDYSQMKEYTHEAYQPLAIDQPPPVPLPEGLWGDRWRFAAIAAADFEPAFAHKPIPIREMSPERSPMELGLASSTLIPGVVIDGGRASMRLARWLQQQAPAWLSYIPGDPDGLILEAGLSDRWVLATFTDTEVIAAAHTFRDRQQKANGLHFLLIQPDDSGITISGVWLLQRSPTP
ncbi:Tab2/Atab2 family RNA-binding protein [Leptolyngbya sp. AN02str]|uniref:Tab2/Atab2 family RNA-binding protein n=1 Tax=Leptolyngbya sp. AN02str TaxID=3423363 RepID=UPI003D31A7C8